MDAFLKHLQSPDFLLFSVCLALILNVLANYVTRGLDRIFGSGKSWMLGISKRSRDKRTARAIEIANWIESHDNGATLALIEANHMSLVGLMILTVVLAGCISAIMTGFSETPTLHQAPLLLILMIFGVVGLGALFIGSQIRTVVMKHPKGLAGLHRTTKPT